MLTVQLEQSTADTSNMYLFVHRQSFHTLKWISFCCRRLLCGLSVDNTMMEGVCSTGGSDSAKLCRWRQHYSVKWRYIHPLQRTFSEAPQVHLCFIIVTTKPRRPPFFELCTAYLLLSPSVFSFNSLFSHHFCSLFGHFCSDYDSDSLQETGKTGRGDDI